MPQTEVKALQDEFAVGALIDPDARVVARTNKDPEAKQVDTISVSGADNDTTYKLKFEMSDRTSIVEFTTDGSAKADELVNGLTSAINDERLISGTVVAEADTGADTVTVTARYAGEGFTLTEEQDSPGHLSISQTTANADAVEIPFGIGLERHGSLSQNRGHQFARKPDASNFTARDLQVTLDGSTDGDYRIKVEYHDGQTFIAEYTASADSEDDILNALRTDFANNGPSLLSASVDTGATPSELHIKPETDGFADFRILEVDGPSQLDESVAAEGDDVRKSFDGIALMEGLQLIEPDVDGARYQPNSHMNVLQADGRTAVAPESTPSEGDYVWVRLSANGDLDELGAFRSDFNSGCVPLDKESIEWERVPDQQDNLAVVTVHSV